MKGEVLLGHKTDYVDTYSPSLLCSLPRRDGHFGVFGEDRWMGYEFSWLNAKGRPEIAGIRLSVSADSACIVESKSMKLYLGSFAQTRFNTRAEVHQTLMQDLGAAFRAPVVLEILTLEQLPQTIAKMPGICLDALDVSMTSYEPIPDVLQILPSEMSVDETLYTHLFRSLCPVTGQPDWASIVIEYTGRQIERQGLLKYLVSYRCHAGFHEAVVEEIFHDLQRLCAPQSLSVYGRFLRRGGLEINPYRSTEAGVAPDYRIHRQ